MLCSYASPGSEKVALHSAALIEFWQSPQWSGSSLRGGDWNEEPLQRWILAVADLNGLALIEDINRNSPTRWQGTRRIDYFMTNFPSGLISLCLDIHLSC